MINFKIDKKKLSNGSDCFELRIPLRCACNKLIENIKNGGVSNTETSNPELLWDCAAANVFFKIITAAEYIIPWTSTYFVIPGTDVVIENLHLFSQITQETGAIVLQVVPSLPLATDTYIAGDYKSVDLDGSGLQLILNHWEECQNLVREKYNEGVLVSFCSIKNKRDETVYINMKNIRKDKDINVKNEPPSSKKNFWNEKKANSTAPEEGMPYNTM